MAEILDRVFFGELEDGPDLSPLQRVIEDYIIPHRSEPFTLGDLAQQLFEKLERLTGYAKAAMQGQINSLTLALVYIKDNFPDGPNIGFEDNGLKTDIYEIRCRPPQGAAFSLILASQYFSDRGFQQWYSIRYHGPIAAERTEAEWEEFHETWAQACPIEESEMLSLMTESLS